MSDADARDVIARALMPFIQQPRWSTHYFNRADAILAALADAGYAVVRKGEYEPLIDYGTGGKFLSLSYERYQSLYGIDCPDVGWSLIPNRLIAEMLSNYEIVSMNSERTGYVCMMERFTVDPTASLELRGWVDKDFMVDDWRGVDPDEAPGIIALLRDVADKMEAQL